MCDSPASLVIYWVHRPFIPTRSDDEAALLSRIVTLNMLELSLANLDLEVDTEANASLDTVLRDCSQSTFVFFPVTISHNRTFSTRTARPRKSNSQTMSRTSITMGVHSIWLYLR